MRLVTIICLGVVLFLGFNAQAGEDYNGKWFNERLTYDIYFTSSDYGANVISDVYIMGFEDIGGRTFLVIRGQGLKIKEEQGYVLFDSITAILPERNFRVKGVTGGTVAY